MPDSADFHNDRSNCLSVLRYQLHVTHNITGTTPDNKCVHVTTDVRFRGLLLVFCGRSVWNSEAPALGGRPPAGPLDCAHRAHAIARPLLARRGRWRWRRAGKQQPRRRRLPRPRPSWPPCRLVGRQRGRVSCQSRTRPPQMMLIAPTTTTTEGRRPYRHCSLVASDGQPTKPKIRYEMLF